jgi:hypothetical protein
MTIRLSFLLLAAALLVSPLEAAPPKVNGFFPAGGQRGTSVKVAVDGEFSRWPVHVWAEGTGVSAQAAKERGTILVTIAPDALPRTYGLRLHDEDGAASLRPFLVGTLPEVLERETNDDPNKPQVLAGSSTINGKLAKMGDVDTFALPLKAGQTLVAALEANRTLRSPMDAHVQIVTADGFVLEHSDDFHGLDPLAVYTAPRAGTYLIRTFAFPSKPDSSIRFAGSDKFVYRLTVTTGAFFDYPYPLAVSRQTPGKVDIVGWNLAPRLKTLAVPSPGSADVVNLAHSDSANSVPLRIEPHPALAHAGPTSRKNPRKLALPVSVTGRMEKAGQVDVYQFDGKKGQKLAFRAAAPSLGFPLEPVLNVLDHEGKSLMRAQATVLGKDPMLDFTPTQDGSFLLEVSDLYNAGGDRHAYLLEAVFPQPDFALKLTADTFVMSAGKTLDIPVAIERTGGFKKEIDLRLEGVPEGVTASLLDKVDAPTTVRTKGKGRGKSSGPAANATLRLQGPAAPFSGPVRLLGVVRGENVTRVGQAAIADLGTTTENLWLTITK